MDGQTAAVGAGEILLTSMDQDGTRGYDLDLLREAARRVSMPVIASGGAGSLAHLAGRSRPALGVLAASIFHYQGSSFPRREPTCGSGAML
jgi:cyclase